MAAPGDPIGDALTGGNGNDTFRVRDGEVDKIDCGAGTRRVLADQYDVIVDATPANANGSCERVVRNSVPDADTDENKTQSPKEDRKEALGPRPSGHGARGPRLVTGALPAPFCVASPRWPTLLRGTRVAPSILAADFARLGAQVEEVMDAGARVIHVDVMDGHFVPPITIGALIVEALDEQVHDAGGWLDVHLMVERPERRIDDFA